MAQRDVRINTRREMRRQITGTESGENQRNRDDEQHPRIDDAHVDIEVRAHDRASDHADEEPDGQTFEDRAVTVSEHIILICVALAPSDMRTPISRVRWATMCD